MAAVAAAETIAQGEIRTANVIIKTTTTNQAAATIKATTTATSNNSRLAPRVASSRRAKLMPRTSGTTLASMRCSKMNKIDRVDNNLVVSSKLRLRVASRGAKEAGAKVDTAMTEERAKNEVAMVGLLLAHQLRP